MDDQKDTVKDGGVTANKGGTTIVTPGNGVCEQEPTKHVNEKTKMAMVMMKSKST